MAEINSDRRSVYDAKPFPVGKASMLTVLFFIILFAAGILLISRYFTANGDNSSPVGNGDTRAEP